MEVIKKGSYVIEPCEPTWEGVSQLSEWDQTGVITHVPTIYFYKPSKQSRNSMMDTLKDSLSRALVHFYPLAGRLRWTGQGRLELLCNAKGVELVEAESTSELTHFGDFSSSTHLFKNLIPVVDYDSKPFEEFPLVIGQLTVFRCGGVALGVTISHVVADDQSALHFMNEWARLARGETLSAAPCIDFTLLRAQDSSPRVQVPEDMDLSRAPVLLGHQNNLEELTKETTVSILPLTKEQVGSLKKTANYNNKNTWTYSRYEAVAAHVWRSACKARALKHEQPTALAFSVDVRGRLNPPLPPKYFGNAIIDVAALASAGEVIENPLSFTCGKIREAIEKVKDEYVWTNIEFLKKLPDFSPIQDLHGSRKGEDGPFCINPNIGVISWLTLPIYGLDFGWGKEIYMGPGTHDSDGDCLMLPGPINDGSVKIALCLQVAHIHDFNKFFYQDVSSETN